MRRKVWNREDGSVFGRTCGAWMKTFLFYWTFYWILFLLMAGGFALFFVSVDQNYPRFNYAQVYFLKTYEELRNSEVDFPQPDYFDNRIGMILPNPGMGMRPNPQYQSTLIRFVQGRPSSYKMYTDHIQAFLDMYENEKQDGEAFIDCDNKMDLSRRDKTKVCRFNVDDLGGGCTWQKDYGYDDGQPCILLKLNKVYGWEPVPYTENNHPQNIEGIFDPRHIAITCEGEGPLDKENIGPLEFWPKEGLPIAYYPYLNQEGYKPPVVFVKFLRPTNGVVINVWCKAWARNIRHHRHDRAGSIHFELLVD